MLTKTNSRQNHILSVINDITQFKQAEQSLKNSLEKEREIGELKSRFVAMASHEFRTPLATISFAAGYTNNTHEIKCNDNLDNLDIYIDEKIGRNIFINLLNNAIKFSPDKDFIELGCEQTEKGLIIKEPSLKRLK